MKNEPGEGRDPQDGVEMDLRALRVPSRQELLADLARRKQERDSAEALLANNQTRLEIAVLLGDRELYGVGIREMELLTAFPVEERNEVREQLMLLVACGIVRAKMGMGQVEDLSDLKLTEAGREALSRLVRD